MSSLTKIHAIDQCITDLKRLRTEMREAGCPSLVKKLISAINSAEGASRHAWRMHRANSEPGIPMRNMRDFDKL